jgi:hypothetical protein
MLWAGLVRSRSATNASQLEVSKLLEKTHWASLQDQSGGDNFQLVKIYFVVIVHGANVLGIDVSLVSKGLKATSNSNHHVFPTKNVSSKYGIQMT